GPATYMQNTGFVLPGFPHMGAWISYGLGGLTENLPTFVVLPDPRGFAPNGPANWSSGFLPAAHQGTMMRVGKPNPIFDLFPPEVARTRGSFDPGVERGGQRFSPPQLGQSRRPRARPSGDGPEHGQTDGRADQGPQCPRPAGGHDRHVDDGVRSHALQSGRQRPRP